MTFPTFHSATYPDPLPGGFTGPESCGTAKPANVISTSFDSQEVEMTAAYEIRQCNEYAKLGMMGVTFLYSSGDNGVAGFNNTCIDPATGAAFIMSLFRSRLKYVRNRPGDTRSSWDRVQPK